MAKIRNAVSTRSVSVSVFQRPKRMTRAHFTTDMDFSNGQLWIKEDAADTDNAYMLTSKRGGSANWLNLGGGSGQFDALTVTNAATIGAGLTVTTGDLTVGALGAGTVISSAAGVFSVLANGADGEIPIGTTGGAMTMATLTAGAGINITEAAGTITITNPGATGTKMTTTDANEVVPDGAGNTDVLGYDANITTNGATANTVKIRLADNVATVGSLTAANDLTMTAGTCTITSDDNAASAIRLRANGGVNETINIFSIRVKYHKTIGTSNLSTYFRNIIIF